MKDTKTNFVRQGNTHKVIPFSQYNLTILDNTLGQIIFEARKKVKLTQEQLAKLAKISKPYVGTIENMRPHPDSGALPKPEKDKIIRLVNALNEKLPEGDKLNLDNLLLMVGHAPENIKPYPKELVMDYDGFDDDDLKEIAAFIEFRRLRKEADKEQQK